MITQQQARAIAASHIAAITDNSCEIVDAATLERAFGWMFFYQSCEYLKTQDPSDALAGNAPLIVDRLTGKVTETGTSHSADYYLAQYEAALELGAA